MTQIAVRLDDDDLARLDEMVAAGRYPSRAAAVRAALTALREADDDRRIADAYEAGYARVPVTDEERGWGEAGALAFGEADALGAYQDPQDDADGRADADAEAVEQALLSALEVVRRQRRS